MQVTCRSPIPADTTNLGGVAKISFNTQLRLIHSVELTKIRVCLTPKFTHVSYWEGVIHKMTNISIAYCESKKTNYYETVEKKHRNFIEEKKSFLTSLPYWSNFGRQFLASNVSMLVCYYVNIEKFIIHVIHTAFYFVN